MKRNLHPWIPLLILLLLAISCNLPFVQEEVTNIPTSTTSAFSQEPHPTQIENNTPTPTKQTNPTPAITAMYPFPTPDTPYINLALGKIVRTSRSRDDLPAEMAVDGIAAMDLPNWWAAGDYATQWIEIDLGAPTTIYLLRLITSQDPNGRTVHLVYGRPPGGGESLLHQFEGITEDGSILTVTPDIPWESIQYLRVETTSTPSWVAWREIEIYGEIE
jgi:hypothetical protein